MGVGALLVSACATVASPEGWAAPVAEGQRLIIQQDRGELSAVSIDGAVATTLWTYPALDDDPDLDAIYATPILRNNTLFVAAHNGVVVALDTSTGRPAGGWPRPVDLDEHIVATPVLEGDQLYVGTEDGNVYTINTSTGAQSLLFEGDGRIWGQPALRGSTLFVGFLDTRTVVAINVDTEAETWSRDIDGAAASDIELAPDSVVVGSLDRSLYALDVTRGETTWRFDGDGWFSSSPLFASDSIFAGTLRGSVYAVDPLSGNERWRFHEEELRFRAAPALVSGVLVMAGRSGELRGLDSSNGDLIWEIDVEDTELDADPARMGSDLVYVTTDGNLVIVSPSGEVTRVTVGG